MIVAAVLACIGAVPVEDSTAVMATHRRTLMTAPDRLDRAESGLWLLDDMLTRAWGADADMEIALVGLPDARRAARIMPMLEDAMEVSALIDVALRAAAGDRLHVGDRARRWSLLHGIVTAAVANITIGPRAGELRREAEPLLRRAVKASHDPSGRAARMFADVLIDLGRTDEARDVLEAIERDSRPTDSERAAARAMALLVLPDHDVSTSAGRLVRTAQTPWLVLVTGEAAVHAADRHGLPWVEVTAIAEPVRRALVRTGLDQAMALDLAVSLAARVDPPGRIETHETAVVLGAARAAMTAGRSADATQWLESHVDRVAGTDDEPVARAALAGALEQAGEPRRSLEAWSEAAACSSGSMRRQAHDEAARLAVDAMAVHGQDSTARAVLEEAAREGSRTDEWLVALAMLDARRGDAQGAMERLERVGPGSPAHLQALDGLVSLLQQQHARLDGWSDDDRDRLVRTRAAALAASGQGRDPGRAAMAGPIAARCAAAIIEIDLDSGDARAASSRLETDRALVAIDTVDLLVLKAKIAATDGQSREVARVLGQLDAMGRMPAAGLELLAWTLGSEHARPVPSPSARRPAALLAVAEAFEDPSPSGDTSIDLAAAEALRIAGRCDAAVRLYDAVITSQPGLAPAVLGRAECLSQREDRASLSIAASGYRAVASMQRASSVERWQLANLRLLEVLAKAGVDPLRINASLERLRRSDPAIDVMIAAAAAQRVERGE